jgi:hypothetical protein
MKDLLLAVSFFFWLALSWPSMLLGENGSGERSPMDKPAANASISTVGWNVFKSKRGWSVRYPPSWHMESVDGDAEKPEDAIQPILRGPTSCYERGEECGVVQIGSAWPPLTREEASVNEKDTLLEEIGDSRFTLLQQGEAKLGGQSAYFIVYRINLYEKYPKGLVFEKIAARFRDYSYFIVCYEEGKNLAKVSEINSPSDWAQNPVFQAIISSFQLTAK